MLFIYSFYLCVYLFILHLSIYSFIYLFIYVFYHLFCFLLLICLSHYRFLENYSYLVVPLLVNHLNILTQKR